jgi:hypothetical protein
MLVTYFWPLEHLGVKVYQHRKNIVGSMYVRAYHLHCSLAGTHWSVWKEVPTAFATPQLH